MSIQWYDKEGNPIEDLSLVESKLCDYKYKVVAQTTLPDGKWVSTVWLGLDHTFSGEGPPLIFETMVFPSKGDFSETYCERYSTLEEARAGHERIVAESFN